MRVEDMHKRPSRGQIAVFLLLWEAVQLFGEEQIQFKPGWNLFSPKEDIQLGQQAAAQDDKQLPLIDDGDVLNYVSRLGRRLAAVAPNNESYPFAFKVVNSPDINASALPGGFIYVNRATIESTQNEAQLAGVIAHEEGHVVMRHATQRATELLLRRLGLGVLEGLIGQGSGLGGRLTELGVNFLVGSALLKYSRDEESQADAVGAYILYHAGFDPRAMTQFFEISQQKYPQETKEYFLDHPAPEHRIEEVEAEIPKLGPPLVNPKTDSPEFHVAKERLLHMTPPLNRNRLAVGRRAIDDFGAWSSNLAARSAVACRPRVKSPIADAVAIRSETLIARSPIKDV
jgi:beta-barrel assembly-enhancing protease